MEDESRVRENQWLAELASEYDDILPYQHEMDVILWLKKKAAKSNNAEEIKKYKALIDEAEKFGGSDEWGELDSGLMGFARLLKLLQYRAQNKK